MVNLSICVKSRNEIPKIHNYFHAILVFVINCKSMAG